MPADRNRYPIFTTSKCNAPPPPGSAFRSTTLRVVRANRRGGALAGEERPVPPRDRGCGPRHDILILSDRGVDAAGSIPACSRRRRAPHLGAGHPHARALVVRAATLGGAPRVPPSRLRRRGRQSYLAFAHRDMIRRGFSGPTTTRAAQGKGVSRSCEAGISRCRSIAARRSSRPAPRQAFLDRYFPHHVARGAPVSSDRRGFACAMTVRSARPPDRERRSGETLRRTANTTCSSQHVFKLHTPRAPDVRDFQIHPARRRA